MNKAKLPIEFTKLRHANTSPLVEDEIVMETASVLDITDFPDEMQECIELDEELDRYFTFLSKLSREELLAIVKYEVYNRVLIHQNSELPEKKYE